jgi:fructose-1-phosphate kinase PfkB-like protein
MKNLYKRNKTYYIRLSINENLKIFFNNKTTYIKRSTMTLTFQQIQEEIEKFKKINYDDIINRNTYLSIKEFYGIR